MNMTTTLMLLVGFIAIIAMIVTATAWTNRPKDANDEPITSWKVWVPAGVAVLATIIMIALLVTNAFGGTDDVVDEATDNTTTTTAPTTPERTGAERCPGGTSDSLRFDAAQLSHPQALTPPLSEARIILDDAYWGELGYACHNMQVLASLTSLNEAKIIGQTTGENPATSEALVASLRENPDFRMEVISATHQEWKSLGIKTIVYDETFGGTIFRLAPMGDTTLVYDEWKVPEGGVVVVDFEYAESEGVGGIVHRYLGLETGWWFTESAVGTLVSPVDLEDNPEFETAMGQSTTDEGESTDDEGESTTDEGESTDDEGSGDDGDGTGGSGGDDAGDCGDDCGTGGGTTPPTTPCDECTTTTSTTTTTTVAPTTTTTVPPSTTTTTKAPSAEPDPCNPGPPPPGYTCP